MNWEAVTSCITAVVALGTFYAWLTGKQERDLNRKLDGHFEYQKEKFTEIGSSLDKLTDGHSAHASQLANHDKRIAIVETRFEHFRRTE